MYSNTLQCIVLSKIQTVQCIGHHTLHTVQCIVLRSHYTLFSVPGYCECHPDRVDLLLSLYYSMPCCCPSNCGPIQCTLIPYTTQYYPVLPYTESLYTLPYYPVLPFTESISTAYTLNRPPGLGDTCFMSLYCCSWSRCKKL